jgi:predicted nucleic acid-binding protein
VLFIDHISKLKRDMVVRKFKKLTDAKDNVDQMILGTFKGRILPFDGEASVAAGRLRAERDRSGRPISIPDAMIAAICRVHGATLATRNVRDFDGLNLKLVNPFEPAA